MNTIVDNDDAVDNPDFSPRNGESDSEDIFQNAGS